MKCVGRVRTRSGGDGIDTQVARCTLIGYVTQRQTQYRDQTANRRVSCSSGVATERCASAARPRNLTKKLAHRRVRCNRCYALRVDNERNGPASFNRGSSSSNGISTLKSPSAQLATLHASKFIRSPLVVIFQLSKFFCRGLSISEKPSAAIIGLLFDNSSMQRREINCK